MIILLHNYVSYCMQHDQTAQQIHIFLILVKISAYHFEEKVAAKVEDQFLLTTNNTFWMFLLFTMIW